MVHYPSLFLTLLLVLASTVSATTYSFHKFAATSIVGDRARIFFYANGTMHVIGSNGITPTPPSFEEWIVGANFANPPTNITNVLPTSDFAAVGYFSQGSPGLLIMRAFYQTTEGDIRSTLFNGSQWTLDPTVIATGAAYETPLSAFRDQDATREVIAVQYIDSNGLLTQRTTTADVGTWSPPITITT